MVTIIIPTFNEEKNIGKIQRQLDGLKGDFEVIFSDGFSRDATYASIYYPKIQESRYRSNQMNSAAKYARGDYLWFLHCDSRIDKDSLRRIEDSLQDIGCFRLRFASDKILLKVIALFSNLRVKYRNIAFGDQGIFIKKSVFEQVGGYDAIPIMEDYALSMKLKKCGFRFKLLPSEIITSARRFERGGIIRTCLLMQKLQHKFRRKCNIQKIYEEYEHDSKSKGTMHKL